MSDPLLRVAKAQLNDCLLNVPAELRVWARQNYPGSYREVLQIEITISVAEEVGVRHAFSNTVQRLTDKWAELKHLWEAR